MGGAVGQNMDNHTEAKVRTRQSDGVQQSEVQNRSQPHEPMEGQGKEMQVLRSMNGIEQPGRNCNYLG